MKNIFSNVFVINLDERIDRWKHITEHLDYVGIKSYTRIPATNLSLHFTTPIRSAQISCFHSHLKAFRKAHEMQLKNILILEDDCVFFDYFKPILFDKEVEEFLENNEWEIFYLGANRKIYKDNNKLIYLSKFNVVNDHVVEIGECGSTHSILFNKTFIEKIVEEYPTDELFYDKAFSLKDECSVYDNFLNYFTKDRSIKKYCIYPIICGQIDSYSDIQFANTSYNQEMIDSWRI